MRVAPRRPRDALVGLELLGDERFDGARFGARWWLGLSWRRPALVMRDARLEESKRGPLGRCHRLLALDQLLHDLLSLSIKIAQLLPVRVQRKRRSLDLSASRLGVRA